MRAGWEWYWFSHSTFSMKAHKGFRKNIISIPKKSVKHFPSGSCLISVQNTAGTIWTQSNLILHKSSLLSLTSACQALATLNWILAPNGLQSPLVMKCPGVHYQQNSNDNLLYDRKERKMRLLRHEWGSVMIQGLQLIWALASRFKVLLLDPSGQKLLSWDKEERHEHVKKRWDYVHFIHSFTQFNPWSVVTNERNISSTVYCTRFKHKLKILLLSIFKFLLKLFSGPFL